MSHELHFMRKIFDKGSYDRTKTANFYYVATVSLHPFVFAYDSLNIHAITVTQFIRRGAGRFANQEGAKMQLLEEQQNP